MKLYQYYSLVYAASGNGFRGSELLVVQGLWDDETGMDKSIVLVCGGSSQFCVFCWYVTKMGSPGQGELSVL
jgi:hypothetical protein